MDRFEIVQCLLIESRKLSLLSLLFFLKTLQFRGLLLSLQSGEFGLFGFLLFPKTLQLRGLFRLGFGLGLCLFRFCSP